MSSRPLYPFGYGLSYTSFEYGDFAAAFQGEELVVSCSITNTGDRGDTKWPSCTSRTGWPPGCGLPWS